jgi:hypothetical protein
MDINQISTFVGLLVTLSVASERVVEIIKGLVPFLNEKSSDATVEGRRRTLLQALAVAAGIGTALLSQTAIQAAIPNSSMGVGEVVALGLLASGGSGFWNSVLTYINKVKDIKARDAEKV